MASQICIEDLPLEILDQIAAILRAIHVPSLVSFAWATRRLRAACLSTLFSRILLTSRLSGDRCVEDLARNDLLRHVRRLTLRKRIHDDRPKTDLVHLPGAHSFDRQHVKRLAPPGRRYNPSSYQYARPAKDGKWTEVLTLLAAVPHLVDLDFDWQDVFPPACLLRHLADNIPSCRLTVRHVEFRQPRVRGRVTANHALEAALTTSRNLHEVVCLFHETSPGSDLADHVPEILMGMAKGGTPNLTSITLQAHRPTEFATWSPESSSTSTGGVACPKEAPVQSLSLLCSSSLSRWMRFLDASLLQSLTLGPQQFEDEHHAAWLAQNIDFPNLKQLDITGPSIPAYNPNVTLKTLFSRLRPLKDLRLHSFHHVRPDLLTSIISRHGATLHSLNLDKLYGMTFDVSKMLQVMQLIGHCCSNLQELETPVPSCPVPHEMASFEPLGKIKTLRRASLALNLPVRSLMHRQEFGPGKTSREARRHPKMDEAHARAIWDCFHRLDSLAIAGWSPHYHRRGCFLMQRSVRDGETVFVLDLGLEEANEVQKAVDVATAAAEVMAPEEPEDTALRPVRPSWPAGVINRCILSCGMYLLVGLMRAQAALGWVRAALSRRTARNPRPSDRRHVRGSGLNGALGLFGRRARWWNY